MMIQKYKKNYNTQYLLNTEKESYRQETKIFNQISLKLNKIPALMSKQIKFQSQRKKKNLQRKLALFNLFPKRAI